MTYSNRKSLNFRTSLIGLSVLLLKEIVIVYSRGFLQPPGIKRLGFGIGVSLLSPLLRPVLGNGDPLIELLGNAEMPLLLSAFSDALPQVICGQPTGRECATQLVSNCRGARLMGIRAT